MNNQQTQQTSDNQCPYCKYGSRMIKNGNCVSICPITIHYYESDKISMNKYYIEENTDYYNQNCEQCTQKYLSKQQDSINKINKILHDINAYFLKIREHFVDYTKEQISKINERFTKVIIPIMDKTKVEDLYNIVDKTTDITMKFDSILDSIDFIINPGISNVKCELVSISKLNSEMFCENNSKYLASVEKEIEKFLSSLPMLKDEIVKEQGKLIDVVDKIIFDYKIFKMKPNDVRECMLNIVSVIESISVGLESYSVPKVELTTDI